MTALHKAWARTLGFGVLILGIAFVMSAPANATAVSTNLTNINGTIQYDAGGLNYTGPPTSGHGTVLADLSFFLPDVSSTNFNTVLGGSSPILATVSFSGQFSGNQETLTFTHTFADGASTINGLLNGFTAFDGQLAGSIADSDVDTFAWLSNVGTGGPVGHNQIDEGTFKLVADITGFTGQGSVAIGSQNTPLSGHLTLKQVNAVPGPSSLGLLAFALIGLGLFWSYRNKQT